MVESVLVALCFESRFAFISFALGGSISVAEKRKVWREDAAEDVDAGCSCFTSCGYCFYYSCSSCCS